ncbi:rhodanese-like domain-containing protein [Thermocoleostomius sinensis]|jgi:rhodanese-related sulfurtransferase|uniref:Rhodanese-like domain-containing protein n=1 Tax=Thermocoleostomius sinensis A174 TaxID=2016057 RepID=A0A9E8ZC52_9CYAN|nr:rhodanese-like domain-containing protein [Thermocoleostomius sinensis]WAL59204.1 rhodanese-like domain-containing protein [Thermocoleostomius sinensis A174]
MSPLKPLAWAIVKQLIRWRFPTVQFLSTQELAAWLEQPSPPLLLDARTPEEYHVSHLAQAQLVTADWQTHLEAVPPKQTPIVVYCSVGYRSAQVTQQLQQQGYSQVFNLEGSIFQWANEHRPLYQADRRVQTVHPYNQYWQWLLDKP